MTIQDIKDAIEEGREVYWANISYRVIKDSIGQYLIKHDSGDCIGLTNQAGDTLNGDETEFFIL